MKHLKLLSAILLLFISTGLYAQDYTLNDVGRYSARNMGSIIKENVIKGYFIFFESEKVDRRNRAFELVILDENLKEVTSERIVEDKRTYLLEATYNGSAILFKFYNSKEKNVFYRTMTNSGKLSDKSEREANKAELGVYNASVSNDLQNTSTYDFGDNLFVDFMIYKDRSYTYKVQAVDNAGKMKWEYMPDDHKGVLTGGFLAANQNHMVVVEAESKSIMSRDYTFNLKLIDNTGNEEFTINMDDRKYTMMPHNAFIDEAKKKIIIMGEYFDGEDKSMKSASLGVFAKTLNMEGDEIQTEFLDWERDVYSKLSAKERSEAAKNYVFFHNIVRTNDGKILAIGEQYKKQVSATGVAMNLAAAALGGSSDASNLEIRMGNIFVIELGADHKLASVQYFEKTPNRVVLEQGAGLTNQHVMARYLKAMGAFDYAYMQNSEDYSKVSFTYYDREKQEGKLGKDLVFHFVNYNATSGQFNEDKINLEVKGSDLYAMPAKPGYVLLLDYDRREKALKLRLEPVNF